MEDWYTRTSKRHIGTKGLYLYPLQTLSVANLQKSPKLNHLVFVSHTSTVYGFEDYRLVGMPETQAHRTIRIRNLRASLVSKKNPLSPPHSPTKVLLSQ